LLFVTQEPAPSLLGYPSLKIRAVYNNIDRNAFFVKARLISDQHTGTPILDASYRCILTDVNESKFVAVAGHPGQNAFGALMAPFAHIGIGRSNNFVEQFTVSVFT
jgi:integrin alpha FG-GAP repeat containing protein 1